MAVINANCIAIYFFDHDSTTQPETVEATELPSTATTGGNKLYHTSAKAFLGFGAYDTQWNEVTYTLAGAATSSSIDLTNTVEDVARNGTGGTIQESNQEWTVTCDGLIQDTNDAGETLMDIARDANYVIVKFQTDKDGTDVEYIGIALLDNVSLSGGVDEIATYTVSMTGVNDLYKYSA